MEREKAALENYGYVVVPAIFTPQQCDGMRDGIESALAECQDDSAALRKRTGSLYGARNLLELWPAVADVWRTQPLTEFLRVVLGGEAGLVRVLYFDKPPEATWSLPWHRDMTIAVADNSLPTAVFANPTRKAGVPHVEAPLELLRQMLTLRIHLDAATEENGPLQVLPGSHRFDGDEPSVGQPAVIYAAAGDVLAMRPLLSHASGASRPGTAQHRRILHLEFAAGRELADGYEWHDFRAV